MVGFCVGSPLGAACSSYVVRTAEAEVLLDCGPGALERLWRRGTLARLDAVIVSHMHQDHMLDLVPLSNQITQGARGDRGADRLHVYVPRPNGVEVLAQLACALDGDPERFVTAFDLRAYDAADRLTLGDMDITFARTAHPGACFAPRICDGSVSLVYGADGAYSPALEAHAANADLLLAEATAVEPSAELERHGHMTGGQAAEIASRAGVGRLVLTHLSPWIERQDTENLRRAVERFRGRVELAHEGLTISVEPADVATVGPRPPVDANLAT